MSLFNINLSGVASDVTTALLDYIVQPLECILQDAINWLIYAFMWAAKMACDIFYAILQNIYNFVLSILQSVITLVAGTINDVVNTIRSKLVPAFVVAVTPRAEEKLIEYVIRGVTSANSLKQGLTRGLLGLLTGAGIPFLATFVGQVVDSVIPSNPIDVTNLLFPIRTLQQFASSIYCPITNVITPSCSSTCGVSGLPVCSSPCVQLNNGNQYCFGLQFVTGTTTTSSTSNTPPPAAIVEFSQTFTD